MTSSGTALLAERERAEILASNLANAETTRTASGGPYQRQHVVFAANPAASSWNGAGTGDPGFLDSLAGASGMPSPTTGQALSLLGASRAGEPAGGVHVAH